MIIFCLFPGFAYAEEPSPSEEEEEIFEQEEHEIHLSEEEVLKWLEQHVPLGSSELKELKKEYPEEYEEEIYYIAENIEYLQEVQARHPEMFERLVKAENLEIKTWKLAEEIEQTKDEEAKKQLTTQLRTILEEIFETRLQERILEIQELEQEINEMKTLIEKRKTMKEKIIERHMMEILSSDDEALEWW